MNIPVDFATTFAAMKAADEAVAVALRKRQGAAQACFRAQYTATGSSDSVHIIDGGDERYRAAQATAATSFAAFKAWEVAREALKVADAEWKEALALQKAAKEAHALSVLKHFAPSPPSESTPMTEEGVAS